jgi:hypothetical protein
MAPTVTVSTCQRSLVRPGCVVPYGNFTMKVINEPSTPFQHVQVFTPSFIGIGADGSLGSSGTILRAYSKVPTRVLSTHTHIRVHVDRLCCGNRRVRGIDGIITPR